MSQVAFEHAKHRLTRGGMDLSRVLPRSVDLEKSARQHKAIQRTQRKLSGAEDLLRLTLAYGFCGMSTRDVAAWATASGLADLTDIAVLKAVRRTGDWLGYLLGALLTERAAFQPGIRPGRCVRLLDATTVSEPGSSNADWRLHLGYDLSRGCVDEVLLSTQKLGEHLARFHLAPGEIVVADRAYATRSGLASVIDAQADFIVRFGWTNVPLRHPDGQEFELLPALRGLADGEVGNFPVTFEAPDGRTLPCRLVAQRLPADKAAKAVERAKRARRHGQVRQETLEAACYVFVLTSLGSEQVGADDVLAIYRMRWQVELVFKRLKSLIRLDELPAQHPDTVRAYLLSKLLGALLVEERALAAVSAFPPERDPRPLALSAH